MLLDNNLGKLELCSTQSAVSEINKEHFLPEWNTEQPDLPVSDWVAYQVGQEHRHQAICEAIVAMR